MNLILFKDFKQTLFDMLLVGLPKKKNMILQAM